MLQNLVNWQYVQNGYPERKGSRQYTSVVPQAVTQFFRDVSVVLYSCGKILV